MRITLALAGLVLLAAACNNPVPMVAAGPAVPCNVGAPVRVHVFGGVKRPTVLAFEPGLTVFAAIQRAGGLENGARAHEVRILRCSHRIGPFPAPAAPGAVTDLPLERGDVVDVPGEMY